MKKYILYLLTGMAACGFCGCEDALDRFPKDRLTPDEFFHTFLLHSDSRKSSYTLM